MDYEIKYYKLNGGLLEYQRFLKLMVRTHRVDILKLKGKDEYLKTSYRLYRMFLIDITKILHGKKAPYYK